MNVRHWIRASGDASAVLTSAARIGPNSIIQTVNALREAYGAAEADAILQRGDHSHLMTTLPSEMIDEQEFLTLIQMLRDQIGIAAAGQILRRSGQLTAGYLLKHRIPRPVQLLLKILPRTAALRVLLSAISKHAWTFVGSGTFRFTISEQSLITITDCIESREITSERPVCFFYTGAFERLLQALINMHAQVCETTCRACGDRQCRFDIVF